jgi:hypothetical protein
VAAYAAFYTSIRYIYLVFSGPTWYFGGQCKEGAWPPHPSRSFKRSRPVARACLVWLHKNLRREINAGAPLTKLLFRYESRSRENCSEVLMGRRSSKKDSYNATYVKGGNDGQTTIHSIQADVFFGCTMLWCEIDCEIFFLASNFETKCGGPFLPFRTQKMSLSRPLYISLWA